MSDSQRQVKMVAEQALASLVERAKRLQLASVSSVQPNGERSGFQEPGDVVAPSSVPATVALKPKQKPSPISVGTQRSMGITARKPNSRKFDLEPSPPPPPSPRELCMIAELRDEYYQTDQLIDQMLLDANNLSQDMLYCSQHQRDLTLVQEIELETTTRSLNALFGALSAELDGNELNELMRRCCNTLSRSKERPTSGSEQQQLQQDQQQQQEMEQQQQQEDEDEEECTVDQFKGPTDFARIKEALADDLLPTENALEECASTALIYQPNEY